LGLADLAHLTISCAHYPMGYHRYKQCGICSACLFRRQVLLVADIDEPQGTYSYDQFGSSAIVNLIPTDKLDYLNAFLRQVAQWTEIETPGRVPEPVEHHLRHTRVLKSGESPEARIALLARNRDEWMTIAEAGRREGYRWARLLSPARTLIGQGVNHAFA
jgi:hypothetical protein